MLVNKMERAKESDVEEIFDLVNASYEVETGDSGVSFKCTPRFITLKEAMGYIPNFWVLRRENQIIACVCAEVKADVVFIGPFAIKVGLQGQGIGSTVLNFAESLAPYPRIHVVSCRSDLFPFYKKRGYVETKAYTIDTYVPKNRLTRFDLQMIEMDKKVA